MSRAELPKGDSSPFNKVSSVTETAAKQGCECYTEPCRAEGLGLGSQENKKEWAFGNFEKPTQVLALEGGILGGFTMMVKKH